MEVWVPCINSGALFLGGVFPGRGAAHSVFPETLRQAGAMSSSHGSNIHMPPASPWAPSALSGPLFSHPKSGIRSASILCLAWTQGGPFTRHLHLRGTSWLDMRVRKVCLLLAPGGRQDQSAQPSRCLLSPSGTSPTLGPMGWKPGRLLTVTRWSSIRRPWVLASMSMRLSISGAGPLSALSRGVRG